MMNVRLLALGTFALLLPISIENPAAPDSVGSEGETRVSVIGGIGHYAIIDRGCEGQVLKTHPHPFQEAGAEVQHRFPSGVTAGVRGGAVRDRAKELVTDYSVYPYRDSLITKVGDNTYFNPSLSIEGRSVGAGMGWIWSRTAFGSAGEHTQFRWSGHFRVGSLDGPYLKASFMESSPLYSGGGYFVLGIGMRPNRLWDTYVGVGGGPYDGPGLAVSLERRVQEHFVVVTRARLGHSGGENQSAIGLGFTYVSAPPVEPRRAPRRERGTIESAWGLAPKRPRGEKAEAPSVRKPPAPQRAAEYGTYQHVDSLPVLLNRTPCAYPETSRNAGVTGTVMVAALIGEDGRVREVKVVRSIPMLDELALECVRQWTFRPAMRSGRPVAYWLAVPVTWELY